MSFGEVALYLFGLLLLIDLLGRLEHFICETLESVAVLGLVLSHRVEDANAIQEAFKFTRPGPVLLVASRLLYIVHEAIHIPLLVVAHRRSRLVHDARLLLLLLLFVAEGHFLTQGVFVGNSQHFFWCPGILHGELTDQGWTPKSLLEEHDNGLVIDLRGDVSLVAKMLDEFSEGLSLLLDNAG
jgi:hypothetical protein